MGLFYPWYFPMIILTVTVIVNITVIFPEFNPMAADTSLQVTRESYQASIHSAQILALWSPLVKAHSQTEEGICGPDPRKCPQTSH